jgi:serine/threonine protein kinase
LTTSSFHPLKIAIDICKGLQYLQSLKLIHRDIKSLNILLDDKWTAKVDPKLRTIMQHVEMCLALNCFFLQRLAHFSDCRLWRVPSLCRSRARGQHQGVVLLCVLNKF